MPKCKKVMSSSWEELPLMLTQKEISDYMGINIKEVRKWFGNKDFPETDSGKVEKNLFRDWYYKNHDNINYKAISRLQISEIVEKTINEFMSNLIKNKEVI